MYLFYSLGLVRFSLCVFSISWQHLPGAGRCCVGLEVGRGSIVGLRRFGSAAVWGQTPANTKVFMSSSSSRLGEGRG